MSGIYVLVPPSPSARCPFGFAQMSGIYVLVLQVSAQLFVSTEHCAAPFATGFPAFRKSPVSSKTRVRLLAGIHTLTEQLF
jgi:hypothetical protein